MYSLDRGGARPHMLLVRQRHDENIIHRPSSRSPTDRASTIQNSASNVVTRRLDIDL